MTGGGIIMSGESLTAHCNALPCFLLQEVGLALPIVCIGIVDIVVRYCDLHKRVLVMRSRLAGVGGDTPEYLLPHQPGATRSGSDNC